MKFTLQKSAISQKEYERLELITPEKPSIAQKLRQFWQAVVAGLKSTEPSVWQIERNGQVLWNGYDPTTGRSVRGLSESDMLVWLEQRHYSHTDFDQPKMPENAPQFASSAALKNCQLHQ